MITARTPLELREKVRIAEGWTWREGENRMKRVAEFYTLAVDHKRNRFTAVRKF